MVCTACINYVCLSRQWNFKLFFIANRCTSVVIPFPDLDYPLFTMRLVPLSFNARGKWFSNSVMYMDCDVISFLGILCFFVHFAALGRQCSEWRAVVAPEKEFQPHSLFLLTFVIERTSTLLSAFALQFCVWNALDCHVAGVKCRLPFDVGLQRLKLDVYRGGPRCNSPVTSHSVYFMARKQSSEGSVGVSTLYVLE